ncbi:hypothetical protein FPANT_3771 [Fusarium pseudoanthophilum]|uniref:Fido domain-containing protein n=1 Tax=Fusarium pseudoanthophilum TaxID=48495 RepID=A0A8H5UUY4_9HYPO|nr:hypothetical protein FPANT_3771 [Fusarium pseudoanthophilum]
MEANTTEPETSPSQSSASQLFSSQTSLPQQSPATTFAVTTPRSFVAELSLMTGLEPNNIIEVLSRMIYGSNMISNAGGSLPTTYRICNALFRGQEIPEKIAQNDFEYNEIRGHMEFRQIPVSPESIMQCYRETVQHAAAAKYLITKIVIQQRYYDEATFQQAHGILTHSTDLSRPQVSWADYGGYYRPLNAPYDPRFLISSQIPTAMFDMIGQLSGEMANLDGQQAMDENFYERISYACRFCERFIQIHPFLDGNGRMYRLFLTTLLLRAGIPPAVYGLYAYDRSRHEPVELACYLNGNQQPLGLQVLTPLGTNTHLVKFVVDHTYCRWKSPENDMSKFLRATGQGP